MGNCKQCNFCEPTINTQYQEKESLHNNKEQLQQSQQQLTESQLFSSASKQIVLNSQENEYISKDFEKHKPDDDYARVLNPEETKDFSISENILFNFQHLGPLEIKTQIKKNDALLPDQPQPYLLKENKAIYIGQWKFGKPYGKGIFYYQNGTVYEGWNENGVPTGEGRKFFPDGSYYIGKFQKSKFCGEGIIRKKNGFVYNGQWKDDQPHGKGKEIWPDNTLFIGSYVDGKKQGKGKFEWMNNKTKLVAETYEGEFKDDLFDGFGIYIWQDGRNYEGSWKQGKMSGNGTFTWKDNRQYQGEYLDDLKHGQGTFKWPDGKSWTGQWIFGKMDGIGTLEKNGKKYVGEWKDGKRIRWLRGNLEQSIKSNISIGLSIQNEKEESVINQISEKN